MTDPLSYRQNVDALSPADLQLLRSGIAKAMTVADNRGYQFFAGEHGIPQFRCQHGTLLFLPWHRAYLYTLELTFRDLTPGFTLAYWDWTSEQAHANGISPAFADKTGADGNPNPLLWGESDVSRSMIERLQQNPQTADVFDFSTSPPRTRRRPDEPEGLPSADQVQAIVAESSTFGDFSRRVEDVHNSVHGWAGGAMGVVPTAAFDPIFWAHHTMIDRLWYLWQLAHPGAGVPASIQNAALDGFTLTVAETLDIHNLGYEYALKAG
jgi:tyrosinase